MLIRLVQLPFFGGAKTFGFNSRNFSSKLIILCTMCRSQGQRNFNYSLAFVIFVFAGSSFQRAKDWMIGRIARFNRKRCIAFLSFRRIKRRLFMRTSFWREATIALYQLLRSLSESGSIQCLSICQLELWISLNIQRYLTICNDILMNCRTIHYINIIMFFLCLVHFGERCICTCVMAAYDTGL